MKILIFLIITSIIILIGKYYNHLINRVLKFLKRNEQKKWQISSQFFSYFLAFYTLNFFSSLGIFLMHFLIFSLLTEVLNKIFRKNDIWKKLYQISIIPFLLTTIFFSYGFLNIRNIVETSYTLKTHKNISPTKVLLLTDTHYGKVLKKKNLEKLKQKLEKEQIDILLLGGDIVDENTTKEEMKEIFKIIRSIKTTKGKYYIYGNHDRQKYTKKKEFTEEELEKTIKENNIEILKDEKKEIENILIIGRDDLSNKRKKLEELLTETINEKYIILIDHQPTDYEKASSLGVDLILSGHTHAGQIFPAGSIIKWFKMADLWYGRKTVGQMEAIVSSGLAGWGYPIRTEKHSEYVLINIEKER